MPNELKVIGEINIVPFFTESDGVDNVLAKIAEEARAHVPDTSTLKGRNAIKANVTLVTKSKTYLEGKRKELADHYKAIPKKIDATGRKTKLFLEELQVEVRQKLTEWEAEEQCKKDEEAAKIAAEKLAAQIVSDHEIANLMNDNIDRDAAEAAKIEADRIEAERVAYESRIKHEAEQRAREEVANKQRESDEKRENEERQRVAEQDRKDREAKAEIERAKQAVIDANNREAQARIDANLREKQAAENERLRIERAKEQEQKQADARAADVEHRRTVNNEILGAMVDAGIPVSSAKKVISEIAKNKIPHVTINY